MARAATVPRARAAGRTGWVGRLPLHAAVILIALVWMVPTVGLLVSSFRPPSEVSQSGWWTALVPPFRFTLENYGRVLTTNNMTVWHALKKMGGHGSVPGFGRLLREMPDLLGKAAAFGIEDFEAGVER